MSDQFVEQLVDELTKPTFVWRFARSMKESTKPWQRKSALTRMANAEKEIREIVFRLVEQEQVKQAVEGWPR